MINIELITNPEVETVLRNYPEIVRGKMLMLRKLVIESASDIDSLTTIEETLKWGEPSYLSKYGSTIRMDWKPKTPNQYALYFKCTSKLIETFKIVFADKFKYEGSRAIVFQLNDIVPKDELKACITAALMYHKVKKLPKLGI